MADPHSSGRLAPVPAPALASNSSPIHTHAKRNVNFVASLELIYICGTGGGGDNDDDEDLVYSTLLYYSLETQVSDDDDNESDDGAESGAGGWQ